MDEIKPPELSPRQLRQLELVQRRDDPKAVAELLASMDRAIKKEAYRAWRAWNLPDSYLDDLESQGVIIALEAIKAYEHDKGASISTFILNNLRFRIKSYIIRKDLACTVHVPPAVDHKHRRRPVDIDAPVMGGDGSSTLADLLPSEYGGRELHADFEYKDYIAKFYSVIDTMPAKEAQIFKWYAAGDTYEVIAEKLGVTRQRIEQIFNRALPRLKNRVINFLEKNESVPARKEEATRITPRRTYYSHGGITLRDYQQDGLEEALSALEESKSVLYVCPTGGGKSYVFSALAAKNKGRTLIIADREHLVKQAAANIKRFTSLSVGLEMGGEEIIEVLPDVLCASIQAISRKIRLRRFLPGDFSLIVVDEADLSVAASYKKVLAHFHDAKVFGCTATPDRRDRISLDTVFDKSITPVDIIDLIDRGFLVPIKRKLVRIKSVDLSTEPDSTSDFSNQRIEELFAKEQVIHEVVRPTLEVIESRPTLVFGATVRHCVLLAEVFNRYKPGIAKVLHGEMSTEDRESLLGAFARGDVQIICSCALLLRGVDLPFVSCVAIARPTKSRALYCQAVGRGTRLCEGKKDLLVLDFTDNSCSHSLASIVDVFGVKDETVRERARELLNVENVETDPGVATLEAENDIEGDEVVRSRIKAVVLYYTKDIKFSKKGIDWDSQPLGRLSDKILAGQLGVSCVAVCHQRSIRGIPPLSRKRVDYKNLIINPLLGTITDSNLASKLGISASAVVKARKMKGVPPSTGIRKSYNKSIDWSLQPLGKMTDRSLAKKLGCTHTLVTKKRISRGIPSFCIDDHWDAQPLGKEPDTEIAKRLGMHKSAVALARKRRGIPACPT